MPRAPRDLHCAPEWVLEHICARTSLLRSSASVTGLVSSRGSGRLMVLSFLTVRCEQLPRWLLGISLCARPPPAPNFLARPLFRARVAASRGLDGHPRLAGSGLRRRLRPVHLPALATAYDEAGPATS